MESITALEAKNTFGETLRKAQQAPLRITKSGKPVAVIMSIENYEMTEELKMCFLQNKIARAEKDLREGNFVDGETFMQELIDGIRK